MRRGPVLDADALETPDSLLSEIAIAGESLSPHEDHDRRRPSPERQQYLKLQGEYVGHLRRLTLPQKERVKAVRAKTGLEEAVALAKKLAK